MLGALESRAGRRGRCLVVAALAVGGLGVWAAPALAGGEWGITVEQHNGYGAQESLCPSKAAEPNAEPPCGVDPYTLSGETFARESAENTYTIKVANRGSEQLGAPVTVLDELPPGMVLTLQGEGIKQPLGSQWKCTMAGAAAAECTTAEPLAPGKEYEPPITLTVHVNPEAAALSENKVRVRGGGAEALAVNKTTVTEAVPFGIYTFTTGVVESLSSPWTGNPFTQAGGHPFAYLTELGFNYTPGESGISSAGGGSKEVQVELPPGFLGNPQNTPRCPLRVLSLRRPCPDNTAVGYTAVSLGGQIEKGRAKLFEEPPFATFSSLLYNLEPAPGHVVALGFIVLSEKGSGGTPIILEGKVRSDGDYGVTVGTNATPNFPRVPAVKLTTCENGAHREVLKGRNIFACNAAPAGSKPFLTNPTECTSAEPGKAAAPLATAVANAWNDPADYQRKTVAANLEGGALSPKSLLTGCESLPFAPEIQFTPSPPSEGGTSQADEPTGMTLALKIPQAKEEPGVNVTAAVKNLKVKLPAGMTLSPSAADGLAACSNDEFGLGTEFGPGSQHSEPAKPASCPLASQIGTVEVFTPLLSGAPVIEGLPRKGEPLTCSPGMWNGGAELSYRWLRDGVAIEGGSGNLFPAKYSVVAADEGEALQCEVMARNAGGSSVAVSQGAQVLPGAFKGQTEIGKKIVKGVTSFKGVTVGAELSGAGIPAGTTVISVTKANEELEMSSAATATGTAEITAIPVTLPLPPSSIAAPRGTASVGNALTCAAGAWAGTGPAFTYRWLRGGVPIAEGETYTLTGEDAGKVIQCQVTGSSGGGSVSADSAAVVAAPVPSPAPPLPGAPLQGQLFVGEPECSPCTNLDAEDGKLFRLFLQIANPLGVTDLKHHPGDGVIVKLHGITKASPTTGQLESEFVQQPQQPFELLQLKLKGGPRAPLANSQRCGPAVTSADLTPWSAPGLGGLTGEEEIPGTPDATPSSQYGVDADGAGGACPGASAFNPSFNAGTTGPTATTAGAFTQFSLTFGREDREQDLSGLEVHLPQGLVGKIAAVKQCAEAEVHAAERNEGECPAASHIGAATAGAGPGPHPFFQKGKVYLTGPYKGAPFGLAVVTPAIAGPFNLGNIVVRAAITIDPSTAAVTTSSDPLPQFKDGVQLRLRKVNVEVNNPGFMLNPTSCTAQQVSAKLTSAQGASAQVSSPFGIGGCANLPFSPELTAEAGGHGSKANGTSFVVRVKARPGQANIRKTFLQLPLALSSRLSTLQKACLAAVFEANPAGCGEGSNIGMAVAHTPLLENPLVGPAYLVSHGGAAFPDVEFVLQGEGIMLILDGKTDIKGGITYSRFETLPDAPVSTFETVLPAGPHSALTPNVPETENFSLCNTALVMPTEITGQNGAVVKQNTRIALAGCLPRVKIASAKVVGNGLIVTFKTGAWGTVWVSGFGLRKKHEQLSPGTHRIRVGFTKLGIRRHKHHKRTSVRVKLVAGQQAVTSSMTVQL